MRHELYLLGNSKQNNEVKRRAEIKSKQAGRIPGSTNEPNQKSKQAGKILESTNEPNQKSKQAGKIPVSTNEPNQSSYRQAKYRCPKPSRVKVQTSRQNIEIQHRQSQRKVQADGIQVKTADDPTLSTQSQGSLYQT